MKKNVTLIKLLDIIFWTTLTIVTIVSMYNDGLKDTINDLRFTNNVPTGSYIDFVMSLIVITIIEFIVSMFRIFTFSIIYFGIKIASIKHNKDRIDKIDLKNDNYYREIIPKYSPAVLSYVDDFKLSQQDIIATVLSLQLKNKISIKDNGIIIIDENIKDLDENEQYVFNKLKAKQFKNISLIEYTSIVQRDSLNHKLLQEKLAVKKKFKKQIITNIIIYLLAILGLIIIPKIFIICKGSYFFVTLIPVLLFMLSIGILIFFPFTTRISIISYKTLNSIDPFVRSKAGDLMNTKLEGLKKYITDFSNLEEKSSEHLVLWEEYLIYSVIFGINTTVVEEIYNKIK